MTDFPLGAILVFEYPRANVHGASLRWERRRLKLEAIRDTVNEPLSPATLAIEPNLRRGRTLLVGLDLDKGADRRFYAESMRNVSVDESQPRWGVAVYRDDGTCEQILAMSVPLSIAESIAERYSATAAVLGNDNAAVILPPGSAIPCPQ